MTAMRVVSFAVTLALAPMLSPAQTLGTFRWQLQPHCNVISLAVVQIAGVFTLDGFDDQCGGDTRAPVTGLATPNPNGTIELGLTVVTTPGSAPVHVAVAIGLATLGGTWRDSTGATGNFAFTPGSGTGGSPRPVPTAQPAIPNAFALRPDGGFLATGSPDLGSIPASGAGTRLMWYPGKSAFRAGRVQSSQWDESNVGIYSLAVGLDTVASNEGSVAFGRETEASGSRSVAYGDSSKATAPHALAGGLGSEATGFASVALGDGATASNTDAVALGFQTVASGSTSFAVGFKSLAEGQSAVAIGMEPRAGDLASIALGRDVHALGRQSVILGSWARSLVIGAFVFGDASTSAPVFAPAQNSFTVRAPGGYRLYTNSSLTTGATLAPGGSGWAALSDANMKENFRDLDGDDVLSKIARMPVREWSYKTQNAAIRHAGPTAQDFYAAFGLGEDERRINTIDADGVALAAIKALEARTRATNAALAGENEALRTALAALRERLDSDRQVLTTEIERLRILIASLAAGSR